MRWPRSLLVSILAAGLAAGTVAAPAAAAASEAGGKITRSEVLERSKSWVDEKVPYSQGAWHKNKYGNYRQDCSGFVSMAWNLRDSLDTGSLRPQMRKIGKSDLKPGDALHILTQSEQHIAVFIRWADDGKSRPVVREEYNWGKVAEERTWNAGRVDKYTPMRYKNIEDDPPPKNDNHNNDDKKNDDQNNNQGPNNDGPKSEWVNPGPGGSGEDKPEDKPSDKPTPTPAPTTPPPSAYGPFGAQGGKAKAPPAAKTADPFISPRPLAPSPWRPGGPSGGDNGGDDGPGGNLNIPAGTSPQLRKFLTVAIPAARKVRAERKVPVSVALGQAGVESGWGTSKLTTKDNNWFGMTCASPNSPGPIAKKCVKYRTGAGDQRYFRSYASVADSFDDYGRNLATMANYKAAFDHTNNPNAFVQAVAKGGYAGNETTYANKVITAMKQNDLYRYDK